MKLNEKVSWLMGRLQRSLFPTLEQCCVSPLSEQEKHLVKILEIVEIERHIPRNSQGMGRPAAERRAIGRSYVAKAKRLAVGCGANYWCRGRASSAALILPLTLAFF